MNFPIEPKHTCPEINRVKKEIEASLDDAEYEIINKLRDTIDLIEKEVNTCIERAKDEIHILLESIRDENSDLRDYANSVKEYYEQESREEK